MRRAVAGTWGVIRKALGGIGAAAVVVALVHWGQLEPLEYWSLAKLFELRGPVQPRAPIVIVTIDEASINELGQWPFARAKHGELVLKIMDGKPLAIAFDVIFDTPSARGPDDDAVLAEAVALAGNVILGAARAQQDQQLEQAGITREVSNFPTPEIRRGALAVAPVNLIEEAGTIRRAPLGVRLGDEWFPALDVKLYEILKKAGVPVAPAPATLDVLVNFAGPAQTFPSVPYYRVVNGEIPAELFRDKIVLIGPTTELLHDIFETAFGSMSGVEIHANVVETFVRGNALREVPKWLSTTMAVFAAVLGAALVVRLHALRAFLVAVLLWTALTAGAFYGFYLADVWMRGMAGTLALGFGYSATVLEHFIREQREKRRLSQFFSPDVLQHVVRARDAMKSNRRLVTVLFSDLRGFTTMSEKLQPEQVAEILQEYLTEMTEIVFRHGGTVDKYIGDCVMALYNAPFEDPKHAANAIRTGLDFQEKTLEVSRKWEEKLDIKIRNGVGINTGEAVVGTMGSRQRLEYTAIGDTINLGARLESITKDYGASIIISEATHDLVRGQFLTRELGAVTVKGKTQPVRIFSVLANDLRKHPRTVLDAAATLTALDGEEAFGVRVQDISEGGVAVEGLPEEWGKGRSIQIRCEGGGLPKPIVAEGTIVWRRDGAAGIAFGSLEPETAAALGGFVASRPRG